MRIGKFKSANASYIDITPNCLKTNAQYIKCIAARNENYYLKSDLGSQRVNNDIILKKR